jgi:uncharacterized protein YndB with AHSA1/START domain
MSVPASRSIVIRRTVAGPRSRVFEAWCRPELMAKWFFPAPGWRAEVSADVRIGGHYRVAMHDPAGGLHLQEGVYRAVEPISRLVFTWRCPELGVDDSLVTVELTDRGPDTEIVLSHELPDEPTILREHEGGWKGCLDSLGRYLET